MSSHSHDEVSSKNGNGTLPAGGVAKPSGPKPLVVQSDGTLLLEVQSEVAEHRASAARLRHQLSAFAHLEKSPEYFHEYRITPISLWNAAQAGWTEAKILNLLAENARYPVPKQLIEKVREALGKFGRVELTRVGADLILGPSQPGDDLLDTLCTRRTLEPYLKDRLLDGTFRINPDHRGMLKVAFIKVGYPLVDHAGFEEGADLTIDLEGCDLRLYQTEAVDAFFADQGGGGGSGVVVLPCGAGKTVVGIGLLSRLNTQALILAPNITAVRQWKKEILAKTKLPPSAVGEYSRTPRGRRSCRRAGSSRRCAPTRARYGRRDRPPERVHARRRTEGRSPHSRSLPPRERRSL